jgi:hypothetical protein
MLKRLGCLVGLLSLLWGGMGADVLEAATVSREVVVPARDLTSRSLNGLDLLELRGGASALAEGAPDLPLLPVHILLPEGSQAVAVRVVPIESTVLPDRYRLGAVGAARPGETTLTLPMDPAILSSATWYPASPLVRFQNGRMRGRSLAAVAVAPVSWLPATGELRLLTRFRVEVTTEERPTVPGDLRLSRESAEGRRSFDEALTALTGAERAAGVLAGASSLYPKINSGAPFAPTFRPSVDGSAVDLVIITTADQEADYQRLADFRTKTGVSAVVRTVDWIQANYPLGVDLQETIRLFIRDAVDKWGTAWVLLGGDTELIPIRYGFTSFYGGEEIPTDLYYTDLDGNWNGDGDAVFGEGYVSISVPGDGVDLYPDVWVGRIPSNSQAEAQLLVDKTLDYMQTPPMGYQNDFLLLGEVLFPQTWNPGDAIQFDGAALCEDVLDSMLVQNRTVRMYENYTAYPGALPEMKAAVLDSIDAGYNLVHHVGHGYINTMSVGLLHQTLINSDADALTNGDEAFLLYAINCTSAAVDYNCIAERYLTNPNGGAFGVMGSTRLDFPSTGRYYQNDFYGYLFHAATNELGKISALSRVPFVPFATQDNTHRWTQFAQIYLGDPNLEFWTDVPFSLTVNHSGTFTLGQGTYTVTVLQGASPLADVRVALFKDGDAYAVGTTNGSGQVVLPFRPDETGSFSVGAYLHGALPYLGSGTVVAPGAAPYLYAVSQGINDDAVSPSIGNGDGKIDSGETVELRFSLKNNGGVTETGISATLSTADPYLSIVDNLAQFTDIAAGQTVQASDPFTVAVLRGAPDRLEAHCTLSVFGVFGVYTQDVILYVHAPVFEYYRQAVRDTVGSGNGDGVLTVNEDFAIVPTLRNIGIGQATSVQVRLRSTDPAVTITDSISVIGTIDPGDTGVNLVDGVAARLSDVTSYHQLRMVVVDSYGEVFSTLVDTGAPAVVTGVTGYGAATSVSLTWAVSTAGDLWGYAIYRAPASTGPYTRVNTWTADKTSYYVDSGLSGLTRYYYKIAAVDTSGNQSALSSASSVSTTLPLCTNFPVEVLTATSAGITLADLDTDGNLEIVTGGEEIYAVRNTGEDFYDGDQDVRTLGPLTSTGQVLYWNTPAAADIDRDGHVEISAVSWNDAKLHVVDDHGVELPGWPKTVNPFNDLTPNPLGSVCLADIDADGDLEIFCQVMKCLFAWHHDGTELRDGDSNPATNGVLLLTASNFSYSTPTVANIDTDPYREIIAGMRDGKLYVFRHDGTPYPGFPFVTGGDITTSPAVGDIDNDGRVEIVFGSGTDSKVYAIRSDKTSAAGFPVGIQLGQDVDSSPALADVTNDGYLDVVIGASNGNLFLFRGNGGTIPTGWPVAIKDNVGTKIAIRSSPAVADVDGDGSLDIVVGDQIGRLHGFTAAGQYLPGFPIQTGNLLESSPAVWDIDNDGLTEIIALSFDQRIYCWDTPWTFNQSKAVWPMFKRNQRNTGVVSDDILAVTAVPDEQTQLRPALLQNYPNPFFASTLIRYRVPEGAAYQGVRLHIFDLNGRIVRTMVSGEQPPGLYELSWDGNDTQGRRVASGIYPYRLEVGGEVLSRKMVILH